MGHKIYEKPVDLEKKIAEWQEPVFSDIGKGILEERYLVKDGDGKIIETPKEMLYRVAHVIGGVDSQYKDFNPEQTEREFYDLMANREFLPNSPALRGAGLNINLSACYVVPIEDSREGIFKEGLYNAVEIQAHGGGTGFNFSDLRAKGSLIKSTRGKASGPISFMKIYDNAIGETIAQGGTRQGANMGILRYDHSDIEKFISCKNKSGNIRNFNISVGITEEFMHMAIEGKEYPLIDHKGKEVGKVNAKEIFDKIVHNAWETGDPGLIYMDRIDRDNPTPHIGKIRGTNPCGEQPLLDLEACDIGSLNVGVVVSREYHHSEWRKNVDWNRLEKMVNSAVHFLDNIIDANKYPLEKTEKEKRQLKNLLEKYVSDTKTTDLILEGYSRSPIEDAVKGNRKIGLGVMGFSNMLIALGIEYGSKESYEVAEELMKFIHEKSREASAKLAETRGVFPNWKGSIYDSESKYFCGKELKLRNATVNTIAPTGTLSTLFGINGGIEPIFALVHQRKAVFDENGKPKLEYLIVDSEFEKSAKEEGIYTPELIQELFMNHGSLQGIKRPKDFDRKKWERLKELFITAHDLSYKDHIMMQNVFQGQVDNAISKTINLPRDATEEDIRGAYSMTLDTKVKGITVYRDEAKEGQVLSTGMQELKGGERPKVIGTTIKQPTPLGKYAFIGLNVFKSNPAVPYESFVNIGKGGKDLTAIGEGFGRVLSLVFSKGGTIEEVVEQLEGIGGETQTGIGSDKVTSLPDAIAKGLSEAYAQLNSNGKNLVKNYQNGFRGNFCPGCGAKLIMQEGCQKCSADCGYSKC